LWKETDKEIIKRLIRQNLSPYCGPYYPFKKF
jgi:hypothetical protein